MMPKEKDKKQPKLNLEYNANFQKFIFDKLGNDEEEGRILRRVKAFTEDDMKARFDGRTRRWLLKELNRWKQLVHKGGTHEIKATLQNLQMLCNASDATPNQVLLSKIPPQDKKVVTLLSLDALQQLEDTIRTTKFQNQFKKYIPVFYNERAMYSGVLLVIGERIAEDMNVIFQFRHYYFNGQESSVLSSMSGRIMPGAYSDSKKYNITHLEKNKFSGYMSLQDFYEENRAKAMNYLKQENDEIRSFYQMFPEWTAKQKEAGENLLYWIEPTCESILPLNAQEVKAFKKTGSFLDSKTQNAETTARKKSK